LADGFASFFSGLAGDSAGVYHNDIGRRVRRSLHETFGDKSVFEIIRLDAIDLAT
jgi:hypothetical protein